MKFVCRKQLGSLRPVNDAGEQCLSGIANGDLVMVEVKRPRNIQHHRLYWALVTLVWQNQERYPTAEDLHEAIKISVGLRTTIQLPNGEVGYIPGSIAFHKMDQTEFSAFYDRVCDVVAKYFLPGVTSEELKREVQTMIGAA
jgi:hypothetical protein